MENAPPQLGNIPQYSEMSIPTLQSNAYNSASKPSANGNPSMQNAKDSMMSSPVAESVKDQHAKTTSEFRNLADSRTRPDQTTATGQPLTHYHSFFYKLLSWENPRATGISFLLSVAFIFAARYLPVLRWSFKVLYIALGITATAEFVGKTALSQGLTSSFRPKKYYTIPRQSLENMLGDVEQLVNFFVIEFQRILFAENLMHTGAAFAAALVSYWLIKFLPLWGLSLMAVSIIYIAPLIYTNNKELIDQQMRNASQIVNSQASQVKDLAGHHTARATETVKAYAGDYSAKAQNYIGSARGRSTSPEVNTGSTSTSGSGANHPVKSEPGFSPPSYSSSDFPHAPKQEPTPGVMSHDDQYAQSQFGGQAEPMQSQYGGRAEPMQSQYGGQAEPMQSQYGDQAAPTQSQYGGQAAPMQSY
ncbi:MAG: hypothetical protein M1830_007609 [Pleopsidium flavum]|nr:MAG: hypothetical protein M1830_007609 [Pleopsidium flavum]